MAQLEYAEKDLLTEEDEYEVKNLTEYIASLKNN